MQNPGEDALPPRPQTSNKGSEAVRVVVRVRPMSGREREDGRECIVQMHLDRGVAVLMRPGGTDKDAKDFTFDAVFDQRCSQQQIFDDTAAEIVDNVMCGFNGTIFCYGQTGAGKSHTMTGPDNGPPEEQGLLPRSFEHIFNHVDGAGADVKYLVRASFLEIYNEEIRDLLGKSSKAKCELKDNPQHGVYVKDLTAFVVNSVDQIKATMQTGLEKRAVSSTNMNAVSSRSHSIFMCTVEQCGAGADGDSHIRVGKLNMVDLAGSERQSKTGATGDRLKEATKINLSLSALGNVISALVDGKSTHIPYRDSKLTRLLQDSLGGNTKTVMVANCGPADYNFDETQSTLRYAYRAKSIKNKPRINEDPKDAMIREFQEEIMRLKAELDAGGPGAPGGALGGGGDAGEDDDDDEDAAAAPAPIIEKRTEVLEKVVERTVVKEVIVEQPPTQEEFAAAQAKALIAVRKLEREHEEKRLEIERQHHLSEKEKQKLAEQCEREKEAALQEQQRKAEIEKRLASMTKQIQSGKQVMEKAMQQEQLLAKKAREKKKQERAEEKLRAKEEQQRQENEMIQEQCRGQEEEVQRLTNKLQKLWGQYQKAQQEFVDIQSFNQSEREDMLEMIRDLRQTLKLKTLIMESFVPWKAIKNTHERAVWDAEEDEWSLRPPQADTETRPTRPPSSLGLPRPTCEYSRMMKSMGDSNPRHLYDNILVTDLDLPERTTEDYEGSADLGERLERLLLVALSADDEEPQMGTPNPDGEENQRRANVRPQSGKKTRPSSRPSTGRKPPADTPPQPAAFPQARGLVSRE